MISKWVEGHIDQASWKMIKLQASQYQWKVADAGGGGTRMDGSMIIKALFDLINPSTKVGTEQFHKIIQNCRLSNFKYNVNDALNEVKHASQQILLQNETYNSLRLHVFDTLLSVKNNKFTQWV